MKDNSFHKLRKYQDVRSGRVVICYDQAEARKLFKMSYQDHMNYIVELVSVKGHPTKTP